MTRLASLAVVLALGAAPLRAPRLAAQAPGDRLALDRFQDSLSLTIDTLALLELERRLIEAAKADRENPLLHLRLGFVALRLGDLGGHSHYDDAAGEFEWAAELRPDWPYPWYGLGLAEYGIGDSKFAVVAGLQAMLGKDRLTRSAVAFARSVQVDPSFVRGLVDLASTALRQRINIKLAVALEALRLAAPTAAGTNLAVLLYRGRVERLAGDPDSALAAFVEYHARGGKPGLGRLELARTRFILGQREGAEDYYAGAGWDDPETVAEYRRDLEPIASDSVLAEFDAARGGRRVRYLREFWRERDATSLRGEHERLREHYRRLHHARTRYALGPWKRRYDWVERYQSGSRDFDDRGVIYIRHGEPTERAALLDPGAGNSYGNESWRYEREDGDLIFHFFAREDPSDYRLVESLFDVPTSAPADLLVSRSGFSRLYARLLTGSEVSRARYAAQERDVGRRSIEVGTTTDSYELRYGRRLDAHTQVVAVGGDSARSHVHVAYAIPAAELAPVRVPGGYAYPVRLRLVLQDWHRDVIGSLDTTLTVMTRAPLGGDAALTGRAAVPAIPGPLSYRLALEHGEGRGMVTVPDSVVAAPVGGGTLALSDLVIGSRASGLVWRPTPHDTVHFNPAGVFEPSGALELYYEVYGLPAGAPYATQVVVTKEGGGLLRKIFGGRKASVKLGFRERAERGVTRARRTIDLGSLDEGRYRLEVVVSDASGRKQRRVRTFEVKSP